MWITNIMTKSTIKTNQVAKADVVCSNNGKVTTNGSCISGAYIVAPYGVMSVPPKNAKAVLVNTSGDNFCMGVKLDTTNLEVGEVKICSLGGACIELKNNGNVYVNGRQI